MQKIANTERSRSARCFRARTARAAACACCRCHIFDSRGSLFCCFRLIIYDAAIRQRDADMLLPAYALMLSLYALPALCHTIVYAAGHADAAAMMLLPLPYADAAADVTCHATPLMPLMPRQLRYADADTFRYDADMTCC